MAIHETIIASTCPPSGNAGAQLGAGSLVVLDAVTGSALASFKPSSAPARGVALVETQGADGGVVFAIQEGRAVLHCWGFQKVGM
jgi:pre-rRNA-processing protein IPI3